ncbi:MAG TPA: BamA/TamA family outer membrane protein, partial [Longimicrobium sp.]|nr:BamA/TamA family outer membrane protein [Longimicrobium sp.]
GALAGGGEALPPQLRLFGGGPLGVRGVAPNLLGPRFLLLRDTTGDGLGCAVAAGACEGVAVDRDLVRVRALGGEALLETSLEARLWISRRIQLAAFVDAGAVWSGDDGGALPGAARSESLVTPGVGALVLSPFGPVRLDVAYDPSPARRLPLLAEDPDGDGFLLLGDAVFDPHDTFRRRLQFQLSLGQTF